MILAPNEHQVLGPVSVFRPSGHGRLRNGLADSGERNLLPRDVQVVDGLLVTTLLRTTWDLGRQRSRESALSGMDQMFRLGGIDRDEFLDGIERFRRMRWVTRLRELGPLADGRAASPGESVLRLRWLDAGLPKPRLQVEVWVDGMLIAVLDIAHEDLRFAAEYDGEEWHSSPKQRAHDEWRRDVVSRQGWVIKAFEKQHVYGPLQCAEQMLRAGVQEARRLHGATVTTSSRR